MRSHNGLVAKFKFGWGTFKLLRDVNHKGLYSPLVEFSMTNLDFDTGFSEKVPIVQLREQLNW